MKSTPTLGVLAHIMQLLVISLPIALEGMVTALSKYEMLTHILYDAVTLIAPFIFKNILFVSPVVHPNCIAFLAFQHHISLYKAVNQCYLMYLINSYLTTKLENVI